MKKKENSTPYSENSALIEQKRREIAERKKRMEELLEASESRQQSLITSVSEQMDVVAKSFHGRSAVREIKQAGCEMISSFHEILSYIRDIQNPKDRAEMMMRLTRLYAIELPKGLQLQDAQESAVKSASIDAIYEPIE